MFDLFAHAQVAQTLGCRAAYRARGYYQDLDNLDWDLSCFIASGWVKLPTAIDPMLTGSSHEVDSASEERLYSPEELSTGDQFDLDQLQSGSDACTLADVQTSALNSSWEPAQSLAAIGPVQPDDSAIAHAAALVSFDCGDDLSEDQYRQLYEIDSVAVASSHDRLHITTITHAGKVQPGSLDSSMALHAGYDAPDDRHIVPVTHTAASSDLEPGSVECVADVDEADADTDVDDCESDDSEYDFDDDDSEESPADDYGSANSLVGEWYYYNTITQQVRVFHSVDTTQPYDVISTCTSCPPALQARVGLSLSMSTAAE